jgi:O-antigen/teichoic acid export membrane protein
VIGQMRAQPVVPEPAGATRALWSAVDAAASPAATLLMLAALVRTLSPSDYGILVIALAASALSMAINPAIAATTTKFVSELHSKSAASSRSVAGVITNSLLAVATIDLVLILGTALFNKSLSTWVFGADVAHSAQASNVLLLAVAAVAIQQIDTVLAASLRGMERFKQQALTEISSRVALAASVAYVAWHTSSLAIILTAQCAVYLISVLARMFMVRKLMPHGQLFEISSRADARVLLRYGGWMWLTALAGVAYSSADRIIVGRTLGTVAAGQYNIFVQLTQLIHFIPSSVFAFSFPAFSRLATQGDSQRNNIARAYKTYFLSICAVAFAIAAAMIVLWPELFAILSGAKSNASRFGAPGILALNFLLLAFNVAPYYLLLALGRARQVSAITTVSMGIALLLTVMLIPRFGLEGAALARLAYGVGALALLWKSNQVLKQPW